ncbi:hypothetical protein PQX77_010609 [Marasmius sp. AFHP31]|nr:hypothetical protein PQX77_010609 [Marasmius sp. AFHP31]
MSALSALPVPPTSEVNIPPKTTENPTTPVPPTTSPPAQPTTNTQTPVSPPTSTPPVTESQTSGSTSPPANPESSSLSPTQPISGIENSIPDKHTTTQMRTGTTTVPGSAATATETVVTSSSNDSDNRPNIGLIVGISLGAILLLLLMGVALICWRRKRRHQRAQASTIELEDRGEAALVSIEPYTEGMAYTCLKEKPQTQKERRELGPGSYTTYTDDGGTVTSTSSPISGPFSPTFTFSTEEASSSLGNTLPPPPAYSEHSCGVIYHKYPTLIIPK